jgi:hypothetical protein
VQDENGLIENVILWDGEAEWSPPVGTTAVPDSTGEELRASIGGWYGAETFHGPTPAIDSIDPVSGAAAGGTTITVAGFNLHLSDIVVKFGGVEATNIQNQTKTSLQCDTPAHAAGAVDVTIENGEGSWTGRSTLSNGYEYTA